MVFWLVLYSMLRPLGGVADANYSLALSLLRDIRQEPLGHRLPLPHVPCFRGYVFEFLTNRLRHSKLTLST